MESMGAVSESTCPTGRVSRHFRTLKIKDFQTYREKKQASTSVVSEFSIATLGTGRRLEPGCMWVTFRLRELHGQGVEPMKNRTITTCKFMVTLGKEVTIKEQPIPYYKW